MGQRTEQSKGAERKPLLTRLARDTRGNTLAMMAAMLVPMAALAGSAVEVSRLYFVKVRLQQACDAGVLAGRKFMTSNTLDATAEARARAFFANNFATGTFGSSGVEFHPSALADGQVFADASADVPMTLARMFGMESTEIEVECQAKLEIPNLDIMFVLDTTGSMADTNAGDTVTRIAALRTSVTDFYTTIQASKVSGTQVRYGFVPYATTVNVGGLLKKEWMVDKWTYQSRIADGVEDVTTTSTGSSTITENSAWETLSGNSETIKKTLPLEACDAPANTNKNTDKTTSKTETQPNGDKWTIVERTRTTTGSTYSVAISKNVCTLTETKYNTLVQKRTETTKPNPNAGTQTTTTSKKYWWQYKPVEYDVSSLKGGTLMAVGNKITAPVANNHGNRTVTWAGCIEERDTVRQTDYTTIPTTAYDLDIDKVPTSGDAKTQWRPSLSGLVFARSSITNWTYASVRSASNFTNMADYLSGFYASCPSAARKLDASLTAGTLKTYLDGLTVSGNTYHDIGFLWGARLISSTGLFASENSTAPNGSDISRHIIFMTDGETDTDITNYDAYGLSALDRRRTDTASLPTNPGQNTIVENRLKALCAAAKKKNMTVWVIAFGVSLNDMMNTCASPGRAYEAKNADQLKQTFAKIASQIAQLRVAK